MTPDFEDVVWLLPMRGDYFGCHLRIWRLEGRTIVVAGNLIDGPYLPQGFIEQCVSEIARKWLPSGEDFEFYQYRLNAFGHASASLTRVDFDIDVQGRGDAAFLSRAGRLAGGLPPEVDRAAADEIVFHNPTWRRFLTPEEFTTETGISLPVFQPKTYTAALVKQPSAKEREDIETVDDPSMLAVYREHLKVLKEAVKDSETGALATAAQVVADMLLLVDRAYTGEAESGRDHLPGQPIRELRSPLLSPEERAVAKSLATRGDHRAYEATASYHAIDALARELESADPVAAKIVEALRFANREIASFLRLARLLPEDSGPEFVVSCAVLARGAADFDFLATVGWRGTGLKAAAEFFPEGFVRFIRSLHEQARPVVAHGRDPYGRRVLRWTTDKTFFVVEWPLRHGESSYPDEANIIAVDDPLLGGGRPVYVRLPDGTHDLLCPYSRVTENPPFTWGYGGSGPGQLEAAIVRACLENETPDPLGRWWLTRLTSEHPPEPRPINTELFLNVGEVRQRLLNGRPPA
ncbi:hypothetical protein [Nonomuraea aurantiaca]|uniref:hypothetical protein n=1 Tax=Nonomuraea aurantiaca TaxID=2878562 RepID=UPI001CD98B1C|nr:hypothetical protein [Nonomuraea aurantiaca]MCA2230341.1 hypothetical protein [Nonomuraea aurantiaca]